MATLLHKSHLRNKHLHPPHFSSGPSLQQLLLLLSAPVRTSDVQLLGPRGLVTASSTPQLINHLVLYLSSTFLHTSLPLSFQQPSIIQTRPFSQRTGAHIWKPTFTYFYLSTPQSTSFNLSLSANFYQPTSFNQLPSPTSLNQLPPTSFLQPTCIFRQPTSFTSLNSSIHYTPLS